MNDIKELPEPVACATCGEEPYYTHEQMREVIAERNALASGLARADELLRRASESLQEWCDRYDFMPDEDAELITTINRVVGER